MTDARKLERGIEAPQVVGGRPRRRGGQPLDANPHCGQHSLAVELSERDQSQTCTDQQCRGGVRYAAAAGSGPAPPRPTIAPNTVA